MLYDCSGAELRDNFIRAIMIRQAIEEHHKNALIEELLRRVDECTNEFQQEKLAHDSLS